MDKRLRKLAMIYVIVTLMVLFYGMKAHATPSTQIWNPSTDIQAVKTWHLGIDNYFSVKDNLDHPYAFPTDVGLTYGLIKNVEVGVDTLYPSEHPLYFNAKYGIPETDSIPAVAVGVFNVGTKKNVTNYDLIYGVVAKTFKPIGRISLGYYGGNPKLLLDETGAVANTGLIASWDKAITDKIWTSVDYASGDSFYGSLSLGGSYAFAPNASVIFAYVIYNNKKEIVVDETPTGTFVNNKNDTFTTQVDINF